MPLIAGLLVVISAGLLYSVAERQVNERRDAPTLVADAKQKRCIKICIDTPEACIYCWNNLIGYGYRQPLEVVVCQDPDAGVWRTPGDHCVALCKTRPKACRDCWLAIGVEATENGEVTDARR